MKIKLIWDFRGGEAAGIASHHAKHLGEFALNNKIKNTESGAEDVSPYYSMAFIITNKEDSERIINLLKPHRLLEIID